MWAKNDVFHAPNQCFCGAEACKRGANLEPELCCCVFFFFLSAVNGFGFCVPLFRLSLSLLFPLNLKQTGYLPTYCKVSQHPGL